LLKQIKYKEAEFAAEFAEQEAARIRSDQARREFNRAKFWRTKTPTELAEMEGRADELQKDWLAHGAAKYAQEKLELKQLLYRTSSEFFDMLSSAASKEDSYTKLAEGPLDRIFKPWAGPRWVEHVFPRTKIFWMEGFVSKLNWEQQKFLFNLPKNLKLAPSK